MSVACDGPADCAAGFACVGGVCRQPCVEPSECADGLSCGPSGFCVQCASDDDCASDMYCGEGICRPDACLARSSSCESATSVKVCSNRGDAEVTFACSGDSSCVGAEGEKWCSGWLCKPGQARCALEGNVAEVCSEDGAHLSEVACGDQAVCVEGECAPLVCEPGEKLCKDGSSHTCNGLGTGSKLDDFCSEGEYCDPDSGLCAFQLCEPNQVGCFENQTGVCDELGSAYEELKACKGTEVCVDGACEPVICTPYATSCENGSVHLCDETGTRTELYEACDASTQYCQQYSGYAYCTYDICEGGAPACNGNVLTTCMVDGSGYQPGGTPCGDGEACVDGECLVTVCSSYSLFCENDDLRVCNATGTGSELYRDCTSNQFCNAATNSCSARICTPGATSCTGNVTRTCNTFGSGYVTGTDCATVPGTACDAGECRPVVCTPSAYSCDQQTLNRCNALGTGLASSYVCPTYEHCFAEGGSAYCRYDLCTAGAPVCDGNTTATCAADGSGPGALGTDCSLAGEACTGGTCRPVVCTVGAMACHNGDFQYCIDNGTAFSLADDCSSSEYCNPVSGCLPQVCVPGVPMCSGEVATTCAADGSGPAAGGTDCAAAEGVCYEATCQPVVCTGEWFCAGQALHHCQGRGTVDETVEVCAVPDSFCDASNQRCSVRICTPGEGICQGFRSTRTCNSEGTAFDNTTTCPTGQACSEGSCRSESELCSMEGAVWSQPLNVDFPEFSSYLAVSEPIAGADARGNILLVLERDGWWTRRYNAATDTWGQAESLSGVSGSPLLAVDPSGDAMLVLQRTRNLRPIALYGIRFEATAGRWVATEDIAVDSNELNFAHPTIKSDARGRFWLAWADGSRVRSVMYDPSDDGWGAVATVSVESTSSGGGRVTGLSLDVTPSGTAALAWSTNEGSSSGNLWWSRSAAANSSWASNQSLGAAGFRHEEPNVRFLDDAGTEALITRHYLLTFQSTPQAFAHRWSATGGMGPQANITYGDGFFRNILPLPNGDVLAVGLTNVGRLSPTLGWQNEANPRTGRARFIVFENGEVLGLNSGFNVSQFMPGVGWSSEMVTGRAGSTLFRLPGCRAAAIFADHITGRLFFTRFE